MQHPTIAVRGGRVATAILSVACLLTPVSTVHAQNEALIDGMQGYLDFATYEAGIILPQQIDETVFRAALFVDTRDAGQFEAGHIPGAVNIEWREVLTRISEIPSDQMVILYCNTGSLSAQATFALRVAGRENVVVLQSGIQGWQKDAPFKP